MRSGERAMRAFDIVRQFTAARPDFLMSDLVPMMREHLGCSTATAYRLARVAIDVLGIHYNPMERLAKRRLLELDMLP